MHDDAGGLDMKIFVTGATGFVGMHVTNDLLARGFSVHAGARDVAKVDRIFGESVVPVEVDFSDKDSINRALTSIRPDVVVHLIGIIAERPSKGTTFDNVHFRLPMDLYEASKQVGVRKVVHMSALGVHPDAPSRYHKSKLRAEQVLRSSGMTYTIFRPSVIIGPEQKLFSDMKNITAMVPVVALPAGGSHLMQPVDVRDVACVFASAVTKSETDNKVYELCGPDVISLRKMLEAAFAIWKKRVLFLSVPKSAMPKAPATFRARAKTDEAIPISCWSTTEAMIFVRWAMPKPRPTTETWSRSLESFLASIWNGWTNEKPPESCCHDSTNWPNYCYVGETCDQTTGFCTTGGTPTTGGGTTAPPTTKAGS